MQINIEDRRLEPILEKVQAGQRLSYDDGLTLFRSHDILTVGYMANLVRERKHGNVTWFNVNRHINPTDVCVASCKLCAFGKHAKDPKAYTWSLEEVWHRAGEGWTEAVTEFHIVGGLHPELTLDWYCEMLRGLKQRFPEVHLKAFTMVEIAFLAQRSKLSIHDTLLKLKDAGMDSLPGGGAEIFNERVRRIICDHKIDGQQWLDVAREAHRVGLKSNCTMLYGHIENEVDRVDHLVKLRELQDETGGFQTFIPLAFHPANTALEHIPTTTGHAGFEDDRGVAADAGQHRSHQGLLGDDDAARSPDRAALWRRRPGWHGGGREDLPRCRIDGEPELAARRTAAIDPRGRPRTDGARHAVPSSYANRNRIYCVSLAPSIYSHYPTRQIPANPHVGLCIS